MFCKNLLLYTKVLRSLFYITALFLFASCSKLGLYEKSFRIPNQSWSYSNKPTFTFNIPDTASLYNIYIVLRHTDGYRYNNIWLKLGSQAPGDSMRYQNINLKLGDDKGWEGQGMDDIFEIRKNITPGPVSFNKPGKYIFTIAQIMREEDLKHILDVGIRIEK